MPSEFELINRYFCQAGLVPLNGDTQLVLGIGDDCALFDVDTLSLACTIDTLVAGVHFLDDTDPFFIGYRALTVNVSDLAAMGATPTYFTLALTLPWADEEWLQYFSQGLIQAAQQFKIYLVGGNTTRGPLSITIQAMGVVDKKIALKRSGAKVGDKIYVSGTLGDAAAGLAIIQEELSIPSPDADYLIQRFYQPTARIELGQALLGVANSCIDISDGLLADLSHIVKASQVGAHVFIDKLPLSSALSESIDHDQAMQWALGYGDDYELCFTVSTDKVRLLDTISKQCNVTLTCVGEIVEGDELKCLDEIGTIVEVMVKGYRHF